MVHSGDLQGRITELEAENDRLKVENANLHAQLALQSIERVGRFLPTPAAKPEEADPDAAELPDLHVPSLGGIRRKAGEGKNV